jgi:hypothetical protein
MTSSWRSYNTIPILEDSFTNGKGLNWSDDFVLTLPTYYKKRHFAETDDPAQKNIRVERRYVGIRLFSLQHPGVLAENARTCFENNFDRIKEQLCKEKASSTLAETIKLNVYPLPEPASDTFKSAITELIPIGHTLTEDLCTKLSGERVMKIKKNLCKDEDQASHLNQPSHDAVRKMAIAKNELHGCSPNYGVNNFLLDRHANTSRHFMRSANHWVSTAWSHAKTTYFCHLAALRADGQLMFFYNASSGQLIDEETSSRSSNVSRNKYSSRRNNISMLIAGYLVENDLIDKNKFDLMENHDIAMELAFLNEVDENGRMDELLNSMVKYHHRVAISSFIFDESDKLIVATNSGEVYSFEAGSNRVISLSKNFSFSRSSRVTVISSTKSENNKQELIFGLSNGQVWTDKNDTLVTLVSGVIRNIIKTNDGKLIITTPNKVYQLTDWKQQPKIIFKSRNLIKSFTWNNKENHGVFTTSIQLFYITPISKPDSKDSFFRIAPVKSEKTGNGFKTYYESVSLSPSGTLLSVLSKRIQPRAPEPVRSVNEMKFAELTTFVFLPQSKQLNKIENLYKIDMLETVIQRMKPDDENLWRELDSIAESCKNQENDKTCGIDTKSAEFMRRCLVPARSWTSSDINKAQSFITSYFDETYSGTELIEYDPITSEILKHENFAWSGTDFNRYQRCCVSRKSLTMEANTKVCILCSSFVVENSETKNVKCPFCKHVYRLKS